MSDNKSAKQKLIKICGPKCFIEALGIRSSEEVEKDLKRYKSKSLRKQLDILTYHHIIERFKGGESTFDNGALLKSINHIWFNRLPEDKQRELNFLFTQYRQLKEIEFKLSATSFIIGRDLQVYESKSINLACQLNYKDCITIPAYTTTEKDYIRLKRFNRAKEKQEARKALDNYFDEIDF